MRIALAISILFLFGLVPATGTADGNPQLVGTVGPDFTIDLKDATGAHLQHLTAGTYDILVHDLSDQHNFVLGSKTNNTRVFETEVPFVGDQTFTVDLTPGVYVYACSPHFQIMFGSFTVTAAPPVTTTKAMSAKVDARTATMSVKRAEAGRYRVTVRDSSRTRNFHLIGPGLNRRTTKTFTGTVTWTLDLGAGTYRFGSDPKLTGRLTVG